ncbi:MAG: putative lipid II flippase FtsW [Lentisphaerae bacterium]|nr:putative lipid II flippase FtsW [Lentisphaerota bacterium]
MQKAASTLIAIVLALLSLGIVMLASTSTVRGAASFDDAGYFFKRQLIWLALAFIAGVVTAHFDYHWWQRRSIVLMIGGVALAVLIAVIVPGLAPEIGGSHRWLRIGPFSLQASEVAKFAMVILMSNWIVWNARRMETLRHGLLIPLGGLGLVLGLLLLEPDFGTTMLTGLVGMLLLYVGGTRVGYLLVAAVSGLCLFSLAVMHDRVRLIRILAFLDPEKHPDAAYHLDQSKNAFIHGGWTGVGLGNSIQKQFYLPEAHTDFILAIIGEELGFIATGVVVLLFFGILVCGLVISRRTVDPFGRLLAFGFTMMIVMQGAINIGVVTGCLPTKGLPLPFISYGGSSLIMSVAAAGVLLNIARHGTKGYKDKHTRTIRDGLHEL